MSDIISIIIGFLVGFFLFNIWAKQLNVAVKIENQKLDENYFIIKKTTAKTIFYSVLLIFWVIVFAVYNNGLMFKNNIFLTIVIMFMIIITFYNVQKSIHRKIIVNKEHITTTNGDTYFLHEFTSCKIIDFAFMLFIDDIPILKIEKDDIGYDLLLEKIYNLDIKIIDLRKKK